MSVSHSAVCQTRLLLCFALQAIVRGVCAIIDAFHFSVATHTSSSLEVADGQEPPEEEEGRQGKGGAVDAGSQLEGNQSAQQDIQAALTRRVLPSLRSQLVHDGEVSIPINLLTFIVAQCISFTLWHC